MRKAAIALLACSLCLIGCVYNEPAAVQTMDEPIINIARSPNNVLAQLGIKGVTTVGGTNLYAGYIVKLNTNGTFDLSILPEGAGGGILLHKLTFVDITNGGSDTNIYNGRIAYPYNSLGDAINYTGDDGVYVLAPGSYGSVIVTNELVENITVIGFSGIDEPVQINLLDFNHPPSFTGSVSAELRNVEITTLRQSLNRTTYVEVYDHTEIDLIQISNTNTIFTIEQDPSVRFTPLSQALYPNFSVIRSHWSAYVDYDAGNTNDWIPDGVVPDDVGEALDTLVLRRSAPTGTNHGELMYWDTNTATWATIDASVSNKQILFGSAPGDNPEFDYFSNRLDAADVPYTPDDGGDWEDPDPNSVQDALDTLVEMSGLWISSSNYVLSNVGFGMTAYGWGDHANEGYITTQTNRFDSLRVANLSDLGPELTTNGTFTSNADGWTLTGEAVWSAGQIQVPLGEKVGNLTANHGVYPVDIDPLNTYTVSFDRDVDVTSSGTITFNMGGVSTVFPATGDDVSYAFYVTATNNSDPLFVITSGLLGKEAVDNVSIKLVKSGDVFVAGDWTVGGVAKIERFGSPISNDFTIFGDLGGSVGQQFLSDGDGTGHWGDPPGGGDVVSIGDLTQFTGLGGSANDVFVSGGAGVGHWTNGTVWKIGGNVIQHDQVFTNGDYVFYPAYGATNGKISIYAHPNSGGNIFGIYDSTASNELYSVFVDDDGNDIILTLKEASANNTIMLRTAGTSLGGLHSWIFGTNVVTAVPSGTKVDIHNGGLRSDGDILPAESDAYSLGSSDYPWSNLYVNTIIGDVTFTNGSYMFYNSPDNPVTIRAGNVDTDVFRVLANNGGFLFSIVDDGFADAVIVIGNGINTMELKAHAHSTAGIYPWIFGTNSSGPPPAGTIIDIQNGGLRAEGDVIPAVSNQYCLGSTNYSWGNLFVTTINADLTAFNDVGGSVDDVFLSNGDGSGHWGVSPGAGPTISSTNTLWLSPVGNDSNSGISPDKPIRTITNAWTTMTNAIAGGSDINWIWHLSAGQFSTAGVTLDNPSTPLRLSIIGESYGLQSGTMTKLAAGSGTFEIHASSSFWVLMENLRLSSEFGIALKLDATASFFAAYLDDVTVEDTDDTTAVIFNGGVDIYLLPGVQFFDGLAGDGSCTVEISSAARVPGTLPAWAARYPFYATEYKAENTLWLSEKDGDDVLNTGLDPSYPIRSIAKAWEITTNAIDGGASRKWVWNLANGIYETYNVTLDNGATYVSLTISGAGYGGMFGGSSATMLYSDTGVFKLGGALRAVFENLILTTDLGTALKLDNAVSTNLHVYLNDVYIPAFGGGGTATDLDDGKLYILSDTYVSSLTGDGDCTVEISNAAKVDGTIPSWASYVPTLPGYVKLIGGNTIEGDQVFTNGNYDFYIPQDDRFTIYVNSYFDNIVLSINDLLGNPMWWVDIDNNGNASMVFDGADNRMGISTHTNSFAGKHPWIFGTNVNTSVPAGTIIDIKNGGLRAEGDIIPTTSNQYSLGSTTSSWDNLFVDSIAADLADFTALGGTTGQVFQSNGDGSGQWIDGGGDVSSSGDLTQFTGLGGTTGQMFQSSGDGTGEWVTAFACYSGAISYTNDTAETVTITTVDTFYPIVATAADWVTNAGCANFEAQTNRLVYTGAPDISVQLVLSAVISPTAQNQDIGIGVLHNGSYVIGSSMHVSASTGDLMPLSTTWILNFSSNDYLEVGVINYTGTANINAYTCVMSVQGSKK